MDCHGPPEKLIQVSKVGSGSAEHILLEPNSNPYYNIFLIQAGIVALWSLRRHRKINVKSAQEWRVKHLNSTQCARQQLPSKSYAACAQPHAQRPYRPCVLSSRGWLRSRRCFWRNYTSFFAGLSHQKRLRDEAFLAAVQRPLFCLNTRHRKLRHSCMRVQGRGSYLAPRCSHLWLCGWKLTAPLGFCHYCSSLFWRLVRPQSALAV